MPCLPDKKRDGERESLVTIRHSLDIVFKIEYLERTLYGDGGNAERLEVVMSIYM